MSQRLETDFNPESALYTLQLPTPDVFGVMRPTTDLDIHLSRANAGQYAVRQDSAKLNAVRNSLEEFKHGQI